MSSRIYRIGFGLLIALTVSITPGWARHRGSNRAFIDSRERFEDGDRDHGRFRDFDRDDDRDDDRGRRFGRDRDRDDDRDGDFDRDDWREVRRGRGVVIVPGTRFFEFGNRPPGWDRGRKTGWGNCDLPPGLAKKEGCHPFIFRRNPRQGRRPVIVIPLP